MCFGAILLSGIGKLVWAYEDAMGGGTSLSREKLAPLYGSEKSRYSFSCCKPGEFGALSAIF